MSLYERVLTRMEALAAASAQGDTPWGPDRDLVSRETAADAVMDVLATLDALRQGVELSPNRIEHTLGMLMLVREYCGGRAASRAPGTLNATPYGVGTGDPVHWVKGLMGEDRRSPLNLNSLLAAVEAAPPVAAVDVLAGAVAEAIGAREVGQRRVPGLRREEVATLVPARDGRLRDGQDNSPICR
jgi:hypothetical protein